ncbi:ACT domain-containing protein [Halomonadaceae bacterium KBTZ08]
MSGVVELDALLRSLTPRLQQGEYVFCTVPGSLDAYTALEPVVTVKEDEGLTLLLPVSVAEREGFSFDGMFRKITLAVHSSLAAVGLTDAVSSRLASNGIPANVVAGYYHDHIFVPTGKAQDAVELLQLLADSRD